MRGDARPLGACLVHVRDEQACVNLAGNASLIEAFTDRVLAWQIAYWDMALKQVGDCVDVVQLNEDLGSQDPSLALRVQDDLGYVLEGDAWQAIFGHYTPQLQGPAAVPRQVQCLRWLLADRRWHPIQIRLAVSADLCGTFTDYGTESRKPARTPRP